MFGTRKLTTGQLRIGIIGGVTILAAGAIGTTAALATSAGRVESTPEIAASNGRVLSIDFATPAPLVMPASPAAGDRLAVLADPPAALAVDASLQSSQDLALIRQTDAVQAHDAQVQAMLWAQEEARMQAQIAAAMRPSNQPMDSDDASASAPASAQGGDPEITASAGDTRKAPVIAN